MSGRLARGAWLLDWLWLLAWGAASSAWCLTASARVGVTFDEPIYLQRGLEGWRTGSHAGLLRLGTMPLPIDVQTFPLYLYEKWTGTALDPAAACHRVLPWARAGTLVFWWLLLAYGRLAGRHLAGPWGGRAAVALLACEPNLLAHATLATTDVAVSAAVLALAYHFRAAREAGWGWRVGVPALCYAAALLAKASGLVFGVLVLLAVEAERVLREGRARGQGPRGLWAAFAPFRRDVVQVGVLGLALTFVYCGSDWQPEASFVKWARGLPDGAARAAMTWLAENLTIFSNAGEAIVRQVRHNLRGHGVYLLGEVHPRALWYYFPVALSIKLPAALLLLFAALAVTRPAALLNWSCAAAAVLLLFSLNCRVQIGIRLVLPLVALAVVGAAAAAVVGAKGRKGEGFGCRPFAPSPFRPFAAGALSPLLLLTAVLWTAASAIKVWPHGLCYANELWGGTGRAYLRLSDSNFDWGQGLKDLAAWQRGRELPVLDVWYFGTDPAAASPALRQVPLHAAPFADADELRAMMSGRYLAVSATLVHGMPALAPPHRRAAAFFRAREPTDRAATFLIYDLGDKAEVAARVRSGIP